jgi:hypothetical protein
VLQTDVIITSGTPLNFRPAHLEAAIEAANMVLETCSRGCRRYP